MDNYLEILLNSHQLEDLEPILISLDFYANFTYKKN